MGIRIVCVDPNAQAHNPRVLIDGPRAACGEVIEVDGVTAAGLIDQPTVWRVHEDDAAALGQVLAELASTVGAPASEASDEPADADPPEQSDLEDEAGDENPEEIQ